MNYHKIIETIDELNKSILAHSFKKIIDTVVENFEWKNTHYVSVSKMLNTKEKRMSLIEI